MPLVLATLGFTFLGEALRDALDPRLQTGFAAMTAPLVAVDDLAVTYAATARPGAGRLRHVDLDARARRGRRHRGRKSGCGKSTLVGAILRPAAAQCARRVGGRDPSSTAATSWPCPSADRRRAARRRHRAGVPGPDDGVQPGADRSATSSSTSSTTARTLGAPGASGRARGMLDRVGIADAGRRLDRYPHELSGGMRQRVAIAAALLTESRPAHRRRADDGARRDDGGADHPSAAGAPARDRRRDPGRHPPPGRRRRALRPRLRHVCGRGGRGGPRSTTSSTPRGIPTRGRCSPAIPASFAERTRRSCRRSPARCPTSPHPPPGCGFAAALPAAPSSAAGPSAPPWVRVSPTPGRALPRGGGMSALLEIAASRSTCRARRGCRYGCSLPVPRRASTSSTA